MIQIKLFKRLDLEKLVEVVNDWIKERSELGNNFIVKDTHITNGMPYIILIIYSEDR